ncbi:MAG: metallophosphoesterase [Cetobacterium sp.]
MNIQEFERKLDYCLKKLNKESDLDWIEIRDELGLDCSGDHLRKLSYAYKEYHEYIQAKGVDSISNEMYDKLLEKEYEVKKLMTKLSDLRTLVNKDSREQARYEQLLDMLRDCITRYEPVREVSIEERNNRKEVICCLSDIHYGITINNSWNKFDSDIAYKRMYKMMKKTSEVGKSNGCDIAHLFIGGDLINNNIHLTSRMSNRETVTKQIVGVSEMIGQAIYCLHKDFEYVMVHMVSGNHDRILPGKDMNDYEDNFVNVIKEFVKLKTEDLGNVIFNENEDGHDIVRFNVCGKSIIGLHGDKISSKQVIQKLSTMYSKVDYVLSGHIHHDKVESFSNSKVISIPSFSGMDEYARQLGLYCRPSQKIIVLENESNDELIYTVDLSE